MNHMQAHTTDRFADTKGKGEHILHVDMDCFFVSVERVLHPELCGLPVAVGIDGNRSVVSSASYEARAYGVRSAMPIRAAKRACPPLRIVHTPGGYYQRASKAVMRILESFTPIVEPVSIDEAYLDVHGAQRLFGSPAAIAEQIREALDTQLSLPASVGVAPTKQMAKLASTLAKPHGIKVIHQAEIPDILHDLPIRRLHGVGQQTAEKLERHRITTCAALLDLPAALLTRLVGPHQAAHLYAAAQGIDPRPVQPPQAQQSISVERTFPTDLLTTEAIHQALLGLADTVGSRIRATHQAALGVRVKIRTNRFTTMTRHHTYLTAVDDSQTIYETAHHLVDQLHIQRAPIRLLGISLYQLRPVETTRQLSFDEYVRWHDIDHVVDQVRSRFGHGSLTRGALLSAKAKEEPLQGG